MIWYVDNDMMRHRVETIDEKPTERGVSSSTHKVYVPIFLLSQVISRAERMFEQACEINLG